MPWCPKCRLEYREGLKKCNDCDSELVEKLEAAEAPMVTEDVEAYLKTAGNSFEAEIIESKLKAYGIPVMKKYRDVGGYLRIYMGATPFGTELYVPSKLLEKALDIISIEQDISVESELDDSICPAEEENPQVEEENPLAEDESQMEDFNRKRKVWTWIFLSLVTPAFMFIVYLLIRLLVYFFK